MLDLPLLLDQRAALEMVGLSISLLRVSLRGTSSTDQCECNAFYEKNPKIAAMEKVDGKRVWRTCDTTQLTTTLYMNYGRAGMIKLGPYGNFTGGISPGGEDFSVPTYGKCLGDNNNDASACGDKAPTELEMKNLQAVGACQTMLTATLTIPYYPKGTDPSTFLSVRIIAFTSFRSAALPLAAFVCSAAVGAWTAWKEVGFWVLRAAM
jgi:hypothetical protein